MGPSISATSSRLLPDLPLTSLDLPGPPGCLFPVGVVLISLFIPWLLLVISVSAIVSVVVLSVVAVVVT